MSSNRSCDETSAWEEARSRLNAAWIRLNFDLTH